MVRGFALRASDEARGKRESELNKQKIISFDLLLIYLLKFYAEFHQIIRNNNLHGCNK